MSEQIQLQSNPEVENVATPQPTEGKVFTQDDIQKIINKTIAKERKRAEEEKTEAERLAKMSAEEKARHEFEKEKAMFEEERQAYLKEKLEMQVVRELNQKNLPMEFSKYLVGSDAEQCLENIKEFEMVFNAALDRLVNQRLKGTTPQVGKVEVSGGISKEDFRKMSLAERQKLYYENIELFTELNK